MPGTLFVVATPIGNLEDISARAIRVLSSVTLIAAEDTRRTAHLLSRYSIRTPTTSLHEHNEALKAPALVARMTGGESLALVTDAGTPALADPGARLVAAAREQHIRVESVPGPSAVMAAISICGFSVPTFAFLGFPPTRSKDRSAWFTDLRTAARPVVFFEAPHRIRSTLEELYHAVGDVRVAIARELTKAHEELVVQPISGALSAPVRQQGEITVVVELGQNTDISVCESFADHERMGSGGDLEAEFGHMTYDNLLSRREAISVLAKRYGLSPREVYRRVQKRHD